jgi:PAS domain-containing protein
VAAQRQGSEKARLLARTVVEEVPVGLLVVDARLRLLEANPAARRLFRVSDPGAGAALVDLVREPGLVGLFEAGVERRGRDEAAESVVVRLDAERPGGSEDRVAASWAAAQTCRVRARRHRAGEDESAPPPWRTSPTS